jgi:hypothetical protein
VKSAKDAATANAITMAPNIVVLMLNLLIYVQTTEPVVRAPAAAGNSAVSMGNAKTPCVIIVTHYTKLYMSAVMKRLTPFVNHTIV